MGKSHKAKAVVITCMDFRFQSEVRKYLKQKDLLENCDRIIIAGGSRDFVKPIKDEFKNYVWTQLKLSIELHDPLKIIIIDHQDCGGYAQDGLIPKGISITEDKEKHIFFLNKFKKILNKKYPGKKIGFVYIGLDGSIQELDI